MDGVEAEGRTVNEATAKALAQLNLRREDVEITVLSEGRPRLLGFGGEPARVLVTPLYDEEEAEDEEFEDEDELEDDEEYEDDDDYEDDDEDDEDDDDEEYEEEEEDQQPQPVRPRRAPVAVVAEPVPLTANPEDVEAAVATLQDLLQLMDVIADVDARAPETAGDGVGLIECVLDITGEDLGILIGRRGTTLAALQYVLNLLVSHKVGHRVSLAIDVDGYKRRREETLVALAQRMADRVRGTGRSVTLEPMPPNERRIVHLTLASDPSVVTVSIGEGESRKVAITPSG